MIRTTSLAAVVSAAVALSAGAASAAQFSWYGLGSLNVNGDVRQTASLRCSDSYPLVLSNVGGSGEGQVGVGGQVLTGGDALCPNVTFYSDWQVQTGAYDAPTDSVPLTVAGITVVTLLGTCSGSVGGTWRNNGAGAGQAVIVGAIPGTVFSLPVACQMNIAATTSPDLTMF